MVEKPVPKMRTSVGWRAPSAVTMASGSTPTTGWSTTVTLGRIRAGYQSLEIRMRLQPIG